MKPVWDRARDMADRRITKLGKEIEDIRQRQRDDEFVYGVGWAYRRKEKAMERRQKELEQLEDFKKQSQKPLKTEDLTMYTFYCKECKTTTYIPCKSRHMPDGDWHECPTCRKMIYGAPNTVKIKIVLGSLRFVH